MSPHRPLHTLSSYIPQDSRNVVILEKSGVIELPRSHLQYNGRLAITCELSDDIQLRPSPGCADAISALKLDRVVHTTGVDDDIALVGRGPDGAPRI